MTTRRAHRPHRCAFRASEREYDLIARAAATMGVSMSEYIRTVMTDAALRRLARAGSTPEAAQ